jgi:hypothetical protein
MDTIAAPVENVAAPLLIEKVEVGQVRNDLEPHELSRQKEVLAKWGERYPRSFTPESGAKQGLGFLSPKGEFWPNIGGCGHSSTAGYILEANAIQCSNFGGSEGTLVDIMGWAKFAHYGGSDVPCRDAVCWAKKLTPAQRKFIEAWYLNSEQSPPDLGQTCSY